MLVSRVGAYLVGMDFIQSTPGAPAGKKMKLLLNVNGSIYVDKRGNRIVNEGERRDVIRDAVLGTPERYGYTVCDVILEVDQNGCAVDDFRLFDILDPYRDNVIKAMDQGAVCLNVDASKSGQTLSAEELAKMDTNNQFGDIAGVGPGRNWAHVNSVDYAPSDDSIIISSRHQSALIKIGRDKKVKWIVGSHEGWKKEFQDKLLTPIDKNGKPLKCEGSKCEGGFDWTWTQHTGWRIDSKSDKDVFYLSVFDNGDARGMEP